MKLTTLEIKNLHGCYNYFVKFNDDITFIYGKNGCGKTTILNIVESIITGKLLNLMSLDFCTIKLNYFKTRKNEKIFEIKKIENKKKQIELQISFNKKTHTINLDEIKYNYIRFDSREMSIHSYLYREYPFLSEIKDTFNYVYLPLNRKSHQKNFEYDDYMQYRKSIHSKKVYVGRKQIFEDNPNTSMEQVEKLIQNSQSQANSIISKYNDEFRNNLLSLFIEFEKITSAEDFFIENKPAKTDLKKTKNEYISILKELNLIKEERVELLENKMDDMTQNILNTEERTLPEIITTISYIKDIAKIKDIVSLAKILEENKSKVRTPIKLFLKTMDSFIGENDEKKICINEIGEVYFTTKYDKTNRSIKSLSSGEKQLITFFANLIFNVKNNEAGIFVVDEPELSLHLSWQKKFVEKAHEINPKIQLIFATHSPEIVSKHRDKMYKLEKIYSKKGAENG